MQEKFCESCGMPMGETDEMYGTESNGSKSLDYCKYCYESGAFTNPNITLNEMIESVSAIMVKDFGFSPEDAKEQCTVGIPKLNRWKAS
ncbi:MAG: zinc ribbon domain-containing protein [Clostridiales bacterium]|nr:zinc ribbon domain-containing protein [Clostridiales bacterium]